MNSKVEIRVIPFGVVQLSIVIPASEPVVSEKQGEEVINLINGTTARTQIVSSPPPTLLR